MHVSPVTMETGKHTNKPLVVWDGVVVTLVFAWGKYEGEYDGVVSSSIRL
jgi:hypothetical protein